MANTKSAKKAAKQNEKKRMINVSRASACKTHAKKLKSALMSENPAREAVFLMLQECQAKLHKAADKGIMKLNTASRKISKLHHMFKAKFNELQHSK